jgi:hypothetical protein
MREIVNGLMVIVSLEFFAIRRSTSSMVSAGEAVLA